MQRPARTFWTAGLAAVLAVSTTGAQNPPPATGAARAGRSLSDAVVPVHDGPVLPAYPSSGVRIPAYGRERKELPSSPELAEQFEFVPTESAGRRVLHGGSELGASMRVSHPRPQERVDVQVTPGQQIDIDKPRVWAAPGDDDISPITGNLWSDGYLVYEDGPPRAAHTLSNAIWNSRTQTVRLTAGQLRTRPRAAAFHLVAELEGRGRRLVVKADDLDGPRMLPARYCVKIYRVWYVRSPKGREPDGWFQDARIPVFEPLRVPAEDNTVPGQTNQAFYIAVYIPPIAKPGLYKTTLHVSDLDDPRYKADIQVQVQAPAAPAPGRP